MQLELGIRVSTGSRSAGDRQMSAQQPQNTHTAKLTPDADILGAARELCRAGGALVAAARDEGAAAGKLSNLSLQGEARLRARFEYIYIVGV